MKKHYVFLTIVLYLFWLLLSGHFTGVLLFLGALSVAVVIWLMRRMDRVDGEPDSLYPSFGLLRYGLWLLWNVVKCNLNVARRIWDPDLPVQCSWERIDTCVSTPLEKTLYANSITLTPGTLTTDVGDDHFLVHSLNRACMESLKSGEMERRIRRLGV